MNNARCAILEDNGGMEEPLINTLTSVDLSKLLTVSEAREKLRTEHQCEVSHTQVVRSIASAKLRGCQVLGRWMVYADGLSEFARDYIPADGMKNIRRRVNVTATVDHA